MSTRDEKTDFIPTTHKTRSRSSSITYASSTSVNDRLTTEINNLSEKVSELHDVQKLKIKDLETKIENLQDKYNSLLIVINNIQKICLETHNYLQPDGDISTDEDSSSSKSKTKTVVFISQDTSFKNWSKRGSHNHKKI